MPPIPAYVSLYGPAVLALAMSLGVAAAAGRATRPGWVRPGLVLACLLGWVALEWGALGFGSPGFGSRWRTAVLTPGVGPAMLIVPAAGVMVVELMRHWRAGRNGRLLSVIAAGWVGWWLARVTAAPAEFWRVGIVTAGLSGLIAWLVARQPEGAPGRGVALGLALCGGLAVSGAPGPWVVAAGVLAVAGAGPLLLQMPGAMPGAIGAALLAGADLARGRLARGHLNGADYACLFALAAPLLVGLVYGRVGKRRGRSVKGRASLRRRA